jgi:hypothetical protein
MAKGFRLVKGRDVLANPEDFLNVRYSKKIEGNVGINFKFNINFDKNSADFSFFKRGIKLGNERVVPALREALDGAMSSSIWAWNSGGTRDIVDTGKLRDSLMIQSSTSGFNVSYGAPYAALVHYGGYIQPYGNANIDKVYIPARPWANSVLLGDGPVPIFDWQAVYRDAILGEFR